MADAAPAHYVRAINGLCGRVSALNSLLAFRAVLYVFCSADRTKSASRVGTLKAKRYSRLSPLSIPIPSRVARDARGFSPQAVQFFANCMYHHTIVHLGPQRHEISLRHLDFVFGPHPVQKNPGQLGSLDLNQSGLALRDHFAA